MKISKSMEIAERYFSKRVIRLVNKSDAIRILAAINISSDTLSEELRNAIKSLNGPGSVVVVWNDKDLAIKFVGWIGKYNIRPFINMSVRKFYLLLLGEDMVKIGKLRVLFYYAIS
jgi:hypothetical protein